MSLKATAVLAATLMLLTLVFVGSVGGAALGAEATLVPLGSAITIRLDRPARQVIVGNPAVADVTVQSPRVLTVFGKAASATSLTVMGEGGKVVLDVPIIVGGSSETGLGVIYAAGKAVPAGGQRFAVECAADVCVTVR
ncbi:MAG TPA: pilus assembly protein N-terminal domain-containing protein [Magnetospirillum sp.]|nr:pilus assembly protein N-terminal domain-containing protein [Magnetospirillum sp.]